MWASTPTTWAPFALAKARASPDEALAFSLPLLCGFDPADPLVPGERRDVLPGDQCLGMKLQCRSQIRGKIVYHSAWNASLADHRLTITCSRSRLQSMSWTAHRSSFRRLTETPAPSRSRPKFATTVEGGLLPFTPAAELQPCGIVRHRQHRSGFPESKRSADVHSWFRVRTIAAMLML